MEGSQIDFTLHCFPSFLSGLLSRSDFVIGMALGFFFVWICSFSYILASQDFVILVMYLKYYINKI